MEHLAARTRSACTEDGARVLLLLEELEEVCGELGCESPREEPPEAAPFEGWPPLSMPDGGEELLRGLRSALARVANLQGRSADACAERLLRAALDAAQLTARCELLAGDVDAIRRILPSLFYVVLLPLGGHEPASVAAERAAHFWRGAAISSGPRPSV
jgi:hypothetical protein